MGKITVPSGTNQQPRINVGDSFQGKGYADLSGNSSNEVPLTDSDKGDNSTAPVFKSKSVPDDKLPPIAPTAEETAKKLGINTKDIVRDRTYRQDDKQDFRRVFFAQMKVRNGKLIPLSQIIKDKDPAAGGMKLVSSTPSTGGDVSIATAAAGMKAFNEMQSKQKLATENMFQVPADDTTLVVPKYQFKSAAKAAPVAKQAVKKEAPAINLKPEGFKVNPFKGPDWMTKQASNAENPTEDQKTYPQPEQRKSPSLKYSDIVTTGSPRLKGIPGSK